VRTITKALRLALPGDRVVIENTGEPYRETLSLVGDHNSGEPGAPFIIEGNGAVLEGSAPVPSDAWEFHHGDVFRFRPERLSHQQLFLAGRPAVRKPIASLDWRLPELEPLEWCLTGGYIYFRIREERLPADFEPSYASLQTGITLYHVHDVVISDLVVQGFQLDGVNAHDGVRGAQLSRLVARGNGRSGISVGGSSKVQIADCLIGDNGAAQLRTEGYSQTRVADTDLVDNTAPATAIQGGRLWIDGEAQSSSER